MASRFHGATGATSIVQLGVAFGVDESMQKIGDVLVSTDEISYDRRCYRDASTKIGYDVSYELAERANAAGKTFEAFRRFTMKSPSSDYNLHFGAILSGAAIVRSSAFRDELVRSVPNGDHRIVGGDVAPSTYHGGNKP